MTTPLMGMTLPIPGETEKPAYAEQLISAMELLDGHSHAEGSGARIKTAAMLVDADLSFGGFFAASLKAAKFADQPSAFGDGELRAIYSVNGDLYWNNGSGTAVRLTDGTGLNASSIGGIGGDYASSTANVTYTDSTKVFAFTQSAGVAAKMAVGPVSIFEEISSANSVTLKSASALAGSYDITLFDALPATNGVVQMSAAGVLDVLAAPGADSLLQSTSGGVLSYVTTLPIGFKATSMELTTPKIKDSSGGQFYNFAASDLAANRTVTLPLLTGNDVFVFEAHAATLTNKTLDDPKFSNPARTFNYTLLGSAIVANRNATLPLLTGDDVFVFEAHAATLTNKTLDAPVFSNTITGTYTLGGTPTILVPAIADLTNMTHDHSNAAGGGQIPTAGIADLAVTGAKMANLTVTGAKMANDTITTVKLENDAVTQDKLAENSVGQSEIKTAQQQDSSIGLPTGETFPVVAIGGQYSFNEYWATSNSTAAGVVKTAMPGQDDFQTNRYIIRNGSGGGVNVYLSAFYIPASPPYDLGNGEIPLFIFVVLNSDGSIKSTGIAPDPPWAYNGPTNIRPDFIDNGRLMKRRRVLPGQDEPGFLEAVHNPVYETMEITQAVKQADMPLIPHPFIDNDLTGKTVVLLEPTGRICTDLLSLHEEEGNVTSLLHDGYLQISNISLDITAPPGVTPVGLKWRNTN